MDKKYQIFISSTFRDLQAERRVAIEQILNLSHIPVGMEAFRAGDDTQWDVIKRRISECDYYIVIVAERWGSEGQSGKSYTQMEYEYAVECEIPVAAFLLHEDSRKTWPQEKIEFKKRSKVNEFRKLCENKICLHWRNADDLGAKIVTSLVKLFVEAPRVGWIRGNAPSPELALSEMTHLLEERRALQERIAVLEKDQENKIVPTNVSIVINYLKNKTISSYVELPADYQNNKEIRLIDILILTKDKLSAGMSFADFGREFVDILYNTYYKDSINFFHDLYFPVYRKIASELIISRIVEVRNVTTYRLDSPQLEQDLYLSDIGKEVCFYVEIDGRNMHSIDPN